MDTTVFGKDTDRVGAETRGEREGGRVRLVEIAAG